MRRQETRRNAINHAMATSAHRISSDDDDVVRDTPKRDIGFIILFPNAVYHQETGRSCGSCLHLLAAASIIRTHSITFIWKSWEKQWCKYCYYTPSMLTQRCHNPHPCQNHCGDLRGDLLHKFLSNVRHPAPSSSLQYYDQQKQQL